MQPHRQRLERWVYELRGSKRGWWPPEARTKAWNTFPLRASGGNQPDQHLDFRLPASRTVRERTPVVLITQLKVLCYSSLCALPRAYSWVKEFGLHSVGCVADVKQQSGAYAWGWGGAAVIKPSLELTPFQSVDSSPVPVSVLQAFNFHCFCPPTLCLLVSSTPRASSARICLQMAPDSSQDIL